MTGLPLKHYDFSEALDWLKQGEKVARVGWNGKRMFLVLIPSYTVQQTKYEPIGIAGKLLPWIGMRTAQGDFVPWLASQTDLLAEDWMVV